MSKVYRTLSTQVNVHTANQVEKLAQHYGLSKANMLMKLIELGLETLDEDYTRSSVSEDRGYKDPKTGRVKIVNSWLRKQL